MIPKTLQIRHHTNNPSAQNIIRKAELALLNIRISDTTANIAQIKKDMQLVEDDLREIIPEEVPNNIIELDRKREQNELMKAGIRQRKKYT